MATLNAPQISGVRIEDIAPEGEYIATCISVCDLFGVERQAYQSSEMETKDVTRFVFGVYDENENTYLVQTFEFTISGAAGSNLMKFLKGWLGRAPEMGWDYCEMIGEGAYISVENKTARNSGTVYSTIASISPVPKKLVDDIWDVSYYQDILDKAENGGNGGGQEAPAPQQQAEAPATPPPAKKAAKKTAKKAAKKAVKRAATPPPDDELDEDVPF